MNPVVRETSLYGIGAGPASQPRMAGALGAMPQPTMQFGGAHVEPPVGWCPVQQQQQPAMAWPWQAIHQPPMQG